MPLFLNKTKNGKMPCLYKFSHYSTYFRINSSYSYTNEKKDSKRKFKFEETPTFFGLESFDFIDEISVPEYPHDNLGITGNLILDYYTGTCIQDIFHKIYDSYCPDHKSPCQDVDRSYTEHRPCIIRDCSEQCYKFQLHSRIL